jgi:DNA-binding transcriptional LysR family regulator
MIAAWEMVRRGLGIGIMSDDIALRTGGVERVLPDFAPREVDMWLTTHRELRTSRRIRVVYDFLAEALTRT